MAVERDEPARPETGPGTPAASDPAAVPAGGEAAGTAAGPASDGIRATEAAAATGVVSGSTGSPAAGYATPWQSMLPALTRRPPYACPRCTGNRASFIVSWPLTWSLRKNAHTGQVEEWRAGPALAMGPGGEPDLSVRCELCGFSGPESMFTAAARRLPPPFPAAPGVSG